MGEATTLLDSRNIAELVIYFETGDSIEKILTKLFHIHSSFPSQSQPVYNSQLCADKLEALSQEQGWDEAVVADYSEDMKLLGSRQRGQQKRALALEAGAV